MRGWLDAKLEETLDEPMDEERAALWFPKFWAMRAAYLGERLN